MNKFIKFTLLFLTAFSVSLSSCKKNDDLNPCSSNSIHSNKSTSEITPEIIGTLHNTLFDSIAYQFSSINMNKTPRRDALTKGIQILHNQGYSIDMNLEQTIISIFDSTLKLQLNNSCHFYDSCKLKLQNAIGNDYQPMFFTYIDSILNFTNLELNPTISALNQLDTLISNTTIAPSSKNYYYIFTSVMKNSLSKYYEIKNNNSHPFHKYTLYRASPSTWIMADGSAAITGAIEGGAAGIAGGPGGVILTGAVGAILYGGLASCTTAAFSDLIDSWF